MAFTNITWACGHSGEMQLYGKQAARDKTVAQQAGRDCLACWLVSQWVKDGDPRANRPDCYTLAKKIAAGKGIRIYGLPENGMPDCEKGQ